MCASKDTCGGWANAEFACFLPCEESCSRVESGCRRRRRSGRTCNGKYAERKQGKCFHQKKAPASKYKHLMGNCVSGPYTCSTCRQLAQKRNSKHTVTAPTIGAESSLSKKSVYRTVRQNKNHGFSGPGFLRNKTLKQYRVDDILPTASTIRWQRLTRVLDTVRLRIGVPSKHWT